MWLSTMTRPGISNAVRAVARHSHNLQRHRNTGLKMWLTPREQVYGLDFRAWLGIGFDCV